MSKTILKTINALLLSLLVVGCNGTSDVVKIPTAIHVPTSTLTATFMPSPVPTVASTPTLPVIQNRYKIEFTVKGGKLWIAIPQEQSTQFDILQKGLAPKPDEYYVDPIYGNVILVYGGSNNTVVGEYEFTSVLPTQYDIVVDNVGEYDKESDLYNLYTREENWIETTNLEIIDLAKSIVGAETNPYLAANKIYEYARDSIKNKSIEWTGDPKTYRNEYGALATIHRGYGSCQNHALVFVALSRAIGIPARVVHGINSISLNQSRNLEDWSHSWAEFYLPNYGWIPADQSDEFGKISNLRIILSVGNNFPLGNSCPSADWYCQNGTALFLNYPFGELTFQVTKVK